MKVSVWAQEGWNIYVMIFLTKSKQAISISDVITTTLMKTNKSLWWLNPIYIGKKKQKKNILVSCSIITRYVFSIDWHDTLYI